MGEALLWIRVPANREARFPVQPIVGEILSIVPNLIHKQYVLEDIEDCPSD